MDEDFFPKSELFEDYYYLTKGKEKCSPGHSFGPMIREDYLLHIIIGGKGVFRTKESTFDLKRGQFFLIFPGEQTYYEADQLQPWEYIWIGFNGRKVNELISSIGITKETPVGNVTSFENIKRKILNMISKNPFSMKSRLELQGDFFHLFSNLLNYSKSVENITVNKINKQLVYVDEAIEIIKNQYSDFDFQIKDISTQLSLNQSYLTSIFKKSTKKTLHEYLIMYRIQKSRNYLETTDLSISEVAGKVGYKNSLSFTRVFKKNMKMTPSRYKQIAKKR